MPDPSPMSPTAPAPDRVALKTLALTDFRNYAAASVAFDAASVVLTGENGAGKTNLLEAISLLTPGRGLRRARLEEMTRVGAERWAVSAIVARNGETARLGTGLVEAGTGEGRARAVRNNGAPASSGDALLEYLRVLWVTPAMDGLFTGAASERRRFLDRLVLTLDAAHGRRVREFDKLATQRNRLLEENASAGWLDAVEAELAERAVAVALARAETTALLSARMERADAASLFPAGRLALEGEFDGAVAGRSAAETELWYRETLAAGRAADRAAGRTLAGPHRSDLDVTHVDKGMPAARSSTGEQKALLIGLVLAHAEIVAETSGMTPILLLDEVAAHLDAARRRALFEKLAALGGQAVMTGTDVGLFAGLPEASQIFRVADNGLTLLPQEERG
jgi:DNA replication and repair protein RecF